MQPSQHSVDHTAVGLHDFGRPGTRQIGRWSKQYHASETETQPAMDALIEWLPRRVPPEEGSRIVHGDYRMDNLVFHKTDPSVIGVLDWELSTIGVGIAPKRRLTRGPTGTQRQQYCRFSSPGRRMWKAVPTRTGHHHGRGAAAG